MRTAVVVRKRRPTWVLAVAAIAVLAPVAWFAATNLASDVDESDPSSAVGATSTTTSVPPTRIDDGLLVFSDEFDDPESGWNSRLNPLDEGVTMTYLDSELRFASDRVGSRAETPFHTLPTAAGITATISPNWDGRGTFGASVMCEYRTSSAREQSIVFVVALNFNGVVSMLTMTDGGEFVPTRPDQQGPVLNGRTTATKLALSCEAADGTLGVTSYIDGVEAVSTQLTVPFTGRWATGVGIIGAGEPSNLGYERVEVRDLTRPANDDPPPISERDERLFERVDFERIGRGFAVDNVADDESGLTTGGLLLRPRSNRVIAIVSPPDRVGGVRIASTFRISDGALPTSTAGVGCLALGPEDVEWVYTLSVEADGSWLIEREDESTGVKLFMRVKSGGPAVAADGPLHVELACSFGDDEADPSGPPVVRIVASVGGQVVADVFDVAPLELHSWATALQSGFPDDGPFDATFSSAVVHTSDG